MTTPVLQVSGLCKTYEAGPEALSDINLSIAKGEIFALLGPNGAGKTTLINIICGLVTASAGSVAVEGFDILKDYRQARSRIGLVPQELATDMFETVWATVSFSRRLFGLATDEKHTASILKSLSLWEKRDQKILALSGGMKRRVLIAKALAHEPQVLFLDEPTAGVDVELRRDMWSLVRKLREGGVTIILTTHYIEEAEQMADRIGIIRKGRLILAEDKHVLMQKLGKRKLRVTLRQPMQQVPQELTAYDLSLEEDGRTLCYAHSEADERIGALLQRLEHLGGYSDVVTRQSTLEEIFVNLVNESA